MCLQHFIIASEAFLSISLIQPGSYTFGKCHSWMSPVLPSSHITPTLLMLDYRLEGKNLEAHAPLGPRGALAENLKQAAGTAHFYQKQEAARNLGIQKSKGSGALLRSHAA